MKSLIFVAALIINFIDVSFSCADDIPLPNHVPYMRGQRQNINPFKPMDYPYENWAWGVGEAIKRGKRNTDSFIKDRFARAGTGRTN